MGWADLIRLAWEAEHEDRPRLRDSLLTLAIASSGPDDSWAERCRHRLVVGRPDHFFAQFSTIALALEDPRVVEAMERLTAKYPTAKVESLLLKARARRGPYLGRIESLEAMFDDLIGTPAGSENLRRDAAQASRGPTSRPKSRQLLAFASTVPATTRDLQTSTSSSGFQTSADWSEEFTEPDPEEIGIYYLTVLLAIAFLFASLPQASNLESSPA